MHVYSIHSVGEASNSIFPFSWSMCVKRENVCLGTKIINWILKRRKSFDNPFFSSSSRCLPNICLKKSHKKWGERKKITSFVVSALTNKLRTTTHTAHKKVGCPPHITTNADFALIKHLTKDSGQSLITYAIKSHHNTRSFNLSLRGLTCLRRWIYPPCHAWVLVLFLGRRDGSPHWLEFKVPFQATFTPGRKGVKGRSNGRSCDGRAVDWTYTGKINAGYF